MEPEPPHKEARAPPQATRRILERRVRIKLRRIPIRPPKSTSTRRTKTRTICRVRRIRRADNKVPVRQTVQELRVLPRVPCLPTVAATTTALPDRLRLKTSQRRTLHLRALLPRHPKDKEFSSVLSEAAPATSGCGFRVSAEKPRIIFGYRRKQVCSDCSRHSCRERPFFQGPQFLRQLGLAS
jgi:hypothetical protein